MAENNTTGAVHLTELSLDLTQFNENIRQIEQATAQVADVSVQNLSKIRDALNISGEQLKLDVNTTGLTQGMNAVSESVKNLTSNTREAKQEFESLDRLVGENASALLKGLNLPVNKENIDKLKDLRDALAGVENEYSKVQIKVKDGDLFRATIQSADEAGRTIQTTFDLTGDSVERLSTTIVEKSAQSSKAMQEQAISANELKSKFNDLSTTANALASAISNTSLDLPALRELATPVNEFKDKVNQTREALEKNKLEIGEANREYSNLIHTQSTLKKIWEDVLRETSRSTSSASVNANQIRRLALQYATLANTIQNSKVSEDSGMKGVAQEAKAAEEELKRLVTGISDGNKIVEGAGERYRELNTRLTELQTQFKDTGYEQAQLLNSANAVESLASKYDALQLKLAKTAADMSKTGVKMDVSGLDNFITRAEELGRQAREAAQSLREVGTASGLSDKNLKELDRQVDQLRNDFEAAKKGTYDYQRTLKPIQQQAQETSTALKALEKSAQFKTQKQEIADLRAEYENFINRLKSAGMSAEEAKSQLAGLDERFRSLQGSVNTSNTMLGRFAARLGETIKWRIAHSAITLLMQSFGNLTRTIIDTEDAIIQLKRVLGDSNLVDSSMANALYDIAYTYGQTFDAVQEVAVKFAQTGMEWDDVLEATRVTMLGLNTAELEVSSATEGLIAIMAQFNIDAQDLETVIDKINITADNFPITSEKIVAALQRAGGTASAFGMSLEETIGVITALGKATGRAGEAIGTALNSLITFSMKGSALDKFSEFLGQDVSNFGVLELWKALSKEINNGNTEIAKMMAQSEEFANLMDESIATAVGLEQEYNLALKEGNEITAEGKDIYATVGTYRQNYFIALLNNISTAIEAIYGMRDAVGYSMRENETAMEAFSKQWNQLVISAKQLAVQFAQAGFLDFMKALVSIGDLSLKITKNIGGLNTVLAITTALLLSMKWEQFTSGAFKFGNSLVSLQQMMAAYNTALIAGKSHIEALGVAMQFFQIKAAGVVSILSLLVVGYGAIATAQEETRRKEREARDEIIRSGEEAKKNIEELIQAYAQYDNAVNDTSSEIAEVNRTREKMLELLGLEIDQNNNVIRLNGELVGSYENLDKIIKTLSEDEYTLIKGRALDAVGAAEENIKAIERIKTSLKDLVLPWTDTSDILMYNNSALIKEMNKTAEGAELVRKSLEAMLEPVKDVDDLTDRIKTFNATLKFIQENYANSVVEGDQFNHFLVEQSTLFQELLDKYNSAEDFLKSLGKDFEDYASKAEEANDATNGLTITTEQLEQELEKISDIMETLNGKVDEFQSAYQTLIGVIDEYNETGIMTADMLQSLLELEPEYIELLDIKDGVIQINDEKLQALIATNDDYMNQLVALTVAEEIDNQLKIAQAASAEGLTIAEYNLKNATENLTLSTYSLVQQFYNGEITAEEFRTAIANLGVEAGVTANNIGTLTQSVMDYTQSLQMFYSTSNAQNMVDSINTSINTARGSIGRYYTPSSSSKKSGSSSSKKEEDPFKARKEALDDLLDAYDHAITLLERKNSRFVKSMDGVFENEHEYLSQVIAIDKKALEEIHALADEYRAADEVKYAEEIRKLQESYIKREADMAKAIADVSDLFDVLEHKMTLMEVANYKIVDPDKQREYAQQTVNILKQKQDELHYRAQMLREMGYSETSEYIMSLQDQWKQTTTYIRKECRAA